MINTFAHFPRDVQVAIALCGLMAVMCLFELWRRTPIGTKSVLVGVHQFLIHPLLLAVGWYIAYGFDRVHVGARPTFRKTPGGWTEIGTKPEFASLWRPALWVAFFVHDFGYIGKPNMDGPEGETHPEFGARLMQRLFGEPWGDFCLLHSRYYAKKKNRPLSPLCFADKWVIVIEPSWLYLPRAWASGELAEYVRNGVDRARNNVAGLTPREYELFLKGTVFSWHRACREYMRRWIDNHIGHYGTIGQIPATPTVAVATMESPPCQMYTPGTSVRMTLDDAGLSFERLRTQVDCRRRRA